MVEEVQLSEDVVGTVSTVLVERYGIDALEIAERQASVMGGLPETWRAISARLQASA